MITAASISAQIVATLDVNLVLAAQAATLGAMVFSYFNDSFFWVINRMLGITNVKEQVMVWSVPTTIGWAVSLVMLLLAEDRKSTRLNSSHVAISYAVFCLNNHNERT